MTGDILLLACLNLSCNAVPLLLFLTSLIDSQVLLFDHSLRIFLLVCHPFYVPLCFSYINI
uniref:Uncharacterized protein n=1 Tax=Arundo donax TaxID=35708 RepID=A0A0A9BZE1_ARUDO